MSFPSTLLATLGIGFALGLRHALDTDHLVAVSTLVARERSFWRSTRIVAVWGLGHTATLFVMGLLVVVLGLKIPASAAGWLEAATATMLILLGTRTLWLWKRSEAHSCFHSHEHHAHEQHADAHFHGEHACSQEKAVTLKNGTRASFFVGVIHGLSGSAELMLLVLATIGQPGWALIYIVVFAMGMMVAMFVLTAFLARLLGLTARFQNGWARVDLGLRALTGVASLGFGAYLMWESALMNAR